MKALSRLRSASRGATMLWRRGAATPAFAVSHGAVSPTHLETPSTPASGNVLVKWLAAGVDDVDLRSPRASADVSGCEGVGVVTKVSPGVAQVSEGDRVVPVKPFVGTWCESRELSESAVMKVRDDLRIELLATLSASPYTAYRLLSDFAQLQQGDVVVQTAGTSAVACALAQLGKRRGLRVVTIVPRDVDVRDYAPTVERLKLLGAEVAVGEQFVSLPGVKAALDDLPRAKLGVHGGRDGAATDVLHALLDDGAPVVCYGGADARGAHVRHFDLEAWLGGADRQVVGDMVNDLSQAIGDGELTAWLQRVPFSQLPFAVDAGGVKQRKLVAVMPAADEQAAAA